MATPGPDVFHVRVSGQLPKPVPGRYTGKIYGSRKIWKNRSKALYNLNAGPATLTDPRWLAKGSDKDTPIDLARYHRRILSVCG